MESKVDFPMSNLAYNNMSLFWSTSHHPLPNVVLKRHTKKHNKLGMAMNNATTDTVSHGSRSGRKTALSII